jgi:hypothetical protein
MHDVLMPPLAIAGFAEVVVLADLAEEPRSLDGFVVATAIAIISIMNIEALVFPLVQTHPCLLRGSQTLGVAYTILDPCP